MVVELQEHHHHLVAGSQEGLRMEETVVLLVPSEMDSIEEHVFFVIWKTL